MALGMSLPASVAAQDKRCVLQIDFVGDTGRRIETGTGVDYFAGGGVRLSCQGLPVSMQSDSIAARGGRVVEFIGHVSYRDESISLDADRGVYHKDGERWEARGNVRTVNQRSGSKLEGPSLDYYREVPGMRASAEMYATARPHIEFVTKDSTGAPGEPYRIDGDRVRILGEDQLWAGGKVTIDRSDFTARGDSLRLDTGTGQGGSLLRTPQLKSLSTDSFTLTGRRIDFTLQNRQLERLIARGDGKGVSKEWTLNGDTLTLDLKQQEVRHILAVGRGRAVSKEWTLTADALALDFEARKVRQVLATGRGQVVSKEWDLVADSIALALADQKLEQTLAWGHFIRPFAKSERYVIQADSLAIDTPGERLDEVRSFGSAWLGGEVDSVTRDRDWLAGDTLTSRFAHRDSAGTSRSVLKEIVARGDARSYYRSTDPKRRRTPSLNYTRGRLIRVTMKAVGPEGVERVEVRGQVDGLQLEPKGNASRRTATAAGTGP